MVKKSNGKEGKETRKKKSYKLLSVTLWHFPSEELKRFVPHCGSRIFKKLNNNNCKANESLNNDDHILIYYDPYE